MNVKSIDFVNTMNAFNITCSPSLVQEKRSSKMKKRIIKPVPQRVEAFQNFYDRRNTRPLFGFFIGSEYPLPRYPASRMLPDNKPLVPDDFVVEQYLADSERLYEIHESAGGDFLWSASPFWGIPWCEVLLGCPIFSSHKTGSISARAPEAFRGPDDIPQFDPDSPWAIKMEEFFRKLSEASEGRWPLGTTRMRGISDLLNILYGTDHLIIKMLEDPDEVEAAAIKLSHFITELSTFQIERIPEFHGGIGSFYYYMWAPPKTTWLQEDAATLLSPDWYSRFIQPNTQKIVEGLDHAIMHMHPSGYLPLEYHLQLKCTAYELHIDEGGPSPWEMEDRYHKIMSQSPLLIWGQLGTKELDWIFNHLPAQGLAVQAAVPSIKDAVNLLDHYEHIVAKAR
jgi:hypothetical protein